jgi:hypothetical protein
MHEYLFAVAEAGVIVMPVAVVRALWACGQNTVRAPIHVV